MIISQLGNAQTLLSEDFESVSFPPTGWTRSNTNLLRPWDSTTVNFTPQGQAEYTISGTKSASVNWVATSNIADLVSPQFSLVGATSPVLTFKAVVGYSYMIVLDEGDLLAQISTNGGTTWTTLWNEDNELGFIDDGDGDLNTDLYNLNIVPVSIDLSQYIGQSNVRIRFRYIATDADIVAIDDVNVLASTLSTSDVKKSETKIFPNPTKGDITVKTDKKIKSTTVTDLTGRIISKGISEKINVSSFSKGTYILRVEFADGTIKTEKIIKD